MSGPLEDLPVFPAELEILQRLADGLSYKEIAQERGVLHESVRKQTHAAFKRLGVHSAAAAIAILGRNGWIDWIVPEPPLEPEPEPEPEAEPDKLADRPFVKTYQHYLDRWLESGMRDEVARDGMRLALLGAQRIDREAA